MRSRAQGPDTGGPGLPVWLIILSAALYMAGLFALAWKRDRKAARPAFRQSATVYALALGVYCTSWTYFGAVGTAAASGWDYLPIYLGPAMVFLVLPGLVRRIGDIARRESISSLSDFLAARYGKSRSLAAAATLAAVAGAIPYIALQLKSVGMSFQALARGDTAGDLPPADTTVLVTALTLAVFAILFGARHSDATRQNAGLMRVLAIEAIVKLGALIAVCALSLALLEAVPAADIAAHASQFTSSEGLSGRFVTITLLSMAAIICLPRQFHVAIIERRSEDDIARARWLFPLYMLATSLVVIPITLAGLSLLPASTSPDLFVLSLPLSRGDGLLALVVFLGGFSAATGMVIVAAVAVSTMVTHDLVVPGVMRTGGLARLGGAEGKRLVLIRRAVIVAVLLLAYAYYRAAGSEALAQIGLLSFAAAVQFAPVLIGAVYWKGGHRNGALAGLVLGMAAWAYTLALPALFGGHAVAAAVPSWLAPQALFGLSLGDPLTHGVAWSLSLNTLVFIVLSLRARERLRDRIQAAVFASPAPDRFAVPTPHAAEAAGITPDGLHALAARFLDPRAVDHAFREFEDDTGLTAFGNGPADWRLIQRTERVLASALGAASARVVMSSAVGGMDVALGDVLTLLDHQTQAERFDRHMLQSMLENVSQGISVVDSEQRLVAWNSRYVELFSYPRDLVRVGTPVARLIEHNIRSGWIPGGEPAVEAERRIAHMRRGAVHRYERRNPDGRYLRITGSPMPGGGYVTTFTDITDDKRREQALVEANETLEARVSARTAELEDALRRLERARREAEGANASKTRFLAAASHDLLQPLNAARLFLGAIDPDAPAPATLERVARADRAIQSADNLLKGLLDISRLDHGDLAARPVVLPLGPLLEDLLDEAAPMAARAGLALRLAPTSLSVSADPDFLQSILRNFISNAQRYTRTGAILIGARRRGDQVRIEVWDTGPGISEDRQALIFEEFQRLAEADNQGVRGAGLGLAVARRMAGLMGAEIGVRSRVGRGSAFHVSVPRAVRRERAKAPIPPGRHPSVPDILNGLCVLCVDDEPSILEGMTALLQRWGCRVATACSGDGALRLAAADPPDMVVADLELGAGPSGLDVVRTLKATLPTATRFILLTAKSSPEVEAAAADLGVPVLRKPASPQALRTLVSGAAAGRAQAAE